MKLSNYLATIFVVGLCNFYSISPGNLQIANGKNQIYISQQKNTQNQPTNSNFPDIQKIIDEKLLIVAMHKDDRSPFFFVNKEGKLAGIDVEIAEALAKSLGVDIKFIRTASSFDEVVDQVANGQAHIGISKLSYTSERAKKVIYLKSYIELHVAFIINRLLLEKFSSNSSLKDIFAKNNDLKLCVIEGTSHVGFAKEVLGDVTLVTGKNWNEIFAMMKENKCVAGIRDDNELKKTLLNDPRQNLLYSIAVLKETSDPISVVVGANMPNLARYFNSIFEHDKKLQFSLDGILKKYKDVL